MPATDCKRVITPESSRVSVGCCRCSLSSATGVSFNSPALRSTARPTPVFCEYNHSPIHLVGAGVPLDRRTAGVRGAADQSPHSLLQELLNRRDDISGGSSATACASGAARQRQPDPPAYVEFDLEAMFAAEVYPDFVLLWLPLYISPASRARPRECQLEKWAKAAHRGAPCARRPAERRPGPIEASDEGSLPIRATRRSREHCAMASSTIRTTTANSFVSSTDSFPLRG